MTAKEGGKKDKTGGRKSHATYWPPDSSLKMRKGKHVRKHHIVALALAGPEQRKLVSVNRSLPGYISSYTEFKAVCRSFNIGVDCYIGDFMNPKYSFPWLDEAISDPEAQVMCAKNDGVSCIAIRQGNHWTTVASLAKWFPNWIEYDVSELLKHIQSVCVDVGVGIQPSPSSLGASLMYMRWNGKKVTRPPNGCRQALLDNLIGGRVSYPKEGLRLPTVTELDLRSAYASCSYGLPVGTTQYIPETDGVGGDYLCDHFRSWYGRCSIVVTSPLLLGVFAVQNTGLAGSATKWTYPREPGTYEAWLWKEEWIDCLASGCQLTVHEAYAWEEVSNGLQPWVEEMEALRYAYEADGEPVKALMVKRSIVAAIGRLGIAPEKRTIVSANDAREGDTPLVYANASIPFSGRYVRVEHEENCGAPVHWHSHILMLCRRRMYHRGLEEIEDGNEIIAENFDALYLAKPSQREVGRNIGEWKSVTLTPQENSETVNIPFARAVVSHQKVSLPGVPTSRRQPYLSEA